MIIRAIKKISNEKKNRSIKIADTKTKQILDDIILTKYIKYKELFEKKKTTRNLL
jgi:hypothetical protein